LETLEKSESVDEELREDIESEVSVALWDTTKIASTVSDTSWSPEEGRLILYEGRDGLEKLLVKYGELGETTKQRKERELTEHKARLSELAAEILDLSRLEQGEGRTLIYAKIMECRLSDPVIDQAKELLEPVTMGDKSWSEFQSEMRALLGPIAFQRSQSTTQ
jgi:hypothetical protein